MEREREREKERERENNKQQKLPTSKQTKGRTKRVWTKGTQAAFNMQKKKLTNWKKPTILNLKILKQNRHEDFYKMF